MRQLKAYGEVLSVDGEVAQVRFRRSAACGRCRACGMLAHQSDIVVPVGGAAGAAVGEQVEVEIQPGKTLWASALVYVLPLLMLALGLVAGLLLAAPLGAEPELLAALLAIVFAALAFVLLKFTAPLYNRTVSGVYRMAGKKPPASTR